MTAPTADRTLTIDTTDREKYQEALQALLDAAGEDRVDEVRFDTSESRQLIIAPGDIVDAADLPDDIATDVTPADPIDDLDYLDDLGQGDGQPPQTLPPLLKPPARNGKRDDWAAFLAVQDIAFTADDNRDELVEKWDAHLAATTTP